MRTDMHNKTRFFPLGWLALAIIVIPNVTLAAGRERTWELQASLFSTSSLSLKGEQGSGLAINSDLGFGVGATYNFNNHWALGFGLDWVSPRYTATYIPEAGPPAQTLRANMDTLSLQVNGTYNFLEGPITPFVQAGFGWTNVDSNIASGPPSTGCWWDPWWGYICDTFYSTYGDDLVSWSGAVGVRWDISPYFSLKGSYGILEMNTSPNTQDASIDSFRADFVWRY
jgi:opacity protein-like surface antigen